MCLHTFCLLTGVALMICYALIQSKKGEEAKSRVGIGQSQDRGEGRRRSEWRRPQMSLLSVSSYNQWNVSRNNLLARECHNIPGRVGTVVVGQLCKVSTCEYSNIPAHVWANLTHLTQDCQAWSSATGKISGLRRSLNVTCRHLSHIVMVAVWNQLELCYCWQALNSKSAITNEFIVMTAWDHWSEVKFDGPTNQL